MQSGHPRLTELAVALVEQWTPPRRVALHVPSPQSCQPLASFRFPVAAA